MIEAGGAAERRDLRRHFRALRRAIGAVERRRAAHAVARRLAATGLLRPGARIALYLVHDGELDPEPILRIARRRGARIFLPVITRAAAGRMRVAPFDCPARAWRHNRFGILEPGAIPRLHRSAADLDLVLLPLVAFDRHGHRLGMGGGFYDRALALRARRGGFRRPKLIGLAFDCQEAESLASAAWDVPLDAIATETRLLRIPSTVPEYP